MRISLAVLSLAITCGAVANLASDEITAGGGTITVTYGPGEIDLPATALHKWVADAAEAVSTYFGHFPVKEVRLRVNIGPGRSGVYRGTTWGRDFGSFTRITVGEKTTAAELTDDWMMTHELMHTGFPSVEDDHHWIEEGLATYVEPIARVQAGQLRPERVWSDMVRDMPQGQPQSGDEGLDRTHTWGRTYWGGALYLLVADVRIRERTKNRKGLQDALRAIVNAGGTISHDWPLEQALETGDRATGVKVLSELYAEMKAAPIHVDLAALWQRLGVEQQGSTVVVHDDAPLAAVRRSIMRKPTS